MKVWGFPMKGHGETALYTVCRRIAVLLFAGVYRYRAQGAENLPHDGPVIVITNHKANLDPVVVGIVFERPLRYMAKKELFGNAALRKFIVSLGAFPIDRGAGDRVALTTSLEILAAGEVLLMFPEGHRQRDDAVPEFLPGVGMIALRSGAAVLPMATDGTQRMLREGRPGLPALRALVGPPLDLSDVTGRNSKTYREAARRMRDAVAGLYARL